MLCEVTGRGKTHQASALGRQLCMGGYTTRFMPVSFLFEEIAAHRASGITVRVFFKEIFVIS
ncbi:MAG: ATP-binding protein [Proteobacteria bacterium]|nr:ATP-binding protein [Pseudomonadota bacterium]